MKMNNRNPNTVSIDGEDLEELKTLCKIGSMVNINGEMKEEFDISIRKITTAFCKLGNIWEW